jgi:uncharacterized oxidoreductase
MPIVAAETLHQLTQAICAAAGSEPHEAELVADHLVAANLAGHDSHGVGMLPFYVRCLGEGILKVNQHAQVLREQGAILVLDGQRGFGQVIACEAMARGIALAAREGLALVALRNSFHIGRIGHWAEQCARAGYASVHFVNVIDHSPIVALHGAGEATLGTNPFCAALPSAESASVLLDMATSKVALGKIRVAANKGLPAPEGTLLDEAGEPTSDGSIMFPDHLGALIAMGEHKGSGLAFICELFAGALTGGRTMQPEHPRAGGAINNMLSIIIDPGAIDDRQRMLNETEAMIRLAKSARPRRGFEEVLLPGEPEQRRRAERSAKGVELDERSWADILAAARTAGVAEPALARIVG